MKSRSSACPSISTNSSSKRSRSRNPAGKPRRPPSGRTITVTTDFGEIPCIAGDAAELREVLTNLIFNAVDALPQGGVITLGTRREGEAVGLEDQRYRHRHERRSAPALPRALLYHQRQTRHRSRSLDGLRHHPPARAARSTSRASSGKGTTFAIRLPPRAAESVTQPGASCRSPTGPLRILVVDDQPILCELVCEHLQEDLHTVETALSGSEALEKFRAGHFDLVITDHVMAGMTGEQLAGKIKELSPETSVILLTGYATESKGENQYSEVIDLVLEKPLSRLSLRHALAKVMAVT